MNAVTAEQVLKILDLTDFFNVPRESVFIPLATKENGDISILPDGRLRIVCPSTGPFDLWLNELKARLEKMDLANVKH